MSPKRGAGPLATAFIPPCSNPQPPRKSDRSKSEDHILVERRVNRLKHDRRVATRREKSPRNDPSFVHLAVALAMPDVTVNMT